MDTKTLERLETCRIALERNPNDRTAVVDTTRLLKEIGQRALGAELIGTYLKSNSPDREVVALAEELGLTGWKAAPAAPAPAAPAAAAPSAPYYPEYRPSSFPSFPAVPADPAAPRAPASFAEVSHHLDTVHGWILKEQEKFLFDKVKSLPDGAVIVEMGCCKGKSTVAMAFACIGTRKHIYSIDTYAGNEGHMGKIEDFLEEWSQNLRRFGLEKYATPLRGYTFEVVPDRSRYPAPDFVFIDASHEFTDVLEDFRTVYPYVKDGGFISFHDVEAGWPGPWRVWKDYAMHVLDQHEYSSTLACGRKVAGRVLDRRAPATGTFPFAKELIKEYSARLGASHPLVQAMETSLAGRWNTREDKEAILRAETRLGEAPEQEFHAVLKDMVLARDGRLDGHIRLWSGLSLLRQGKFEEALGHFLAVPKVSSPLPRERTLSYLDFISRQSPGAVTAERPLGRQGEPFRSHVRENHTVYALGGDGSLLSGISCACKIGVEADRDRRKHSITEYGVDSLEAWEDLAPGSADVIVSDDGLSRDAAPLVSLKRAFSRLKPGGVAVFTVGRYGADGEPALYTWNRETLGNLFRAAGFEIRSVEPLEGLDKSLKMVAAKP